MFKTCEICNESFDAYQQRQTTCSKICKAAQRKIRDVSRRVDDPVEHRRRMDLENDAERRRWAKFKVKNPFGHMEYCRTRYARAVSIPKRLDDKAACNKRYYDKRAETETEEAKTKRLARVNENRKRRIADRGRANLKTLLAQNKPKGTNQ